MGLWHFLQQIYFANIFKKSNICKYFASRSPQCQSWRGLRKRWNCCVGIEQTQEGDNNDLDDDYNDDDDNDNDDDDDDHDGDEACESNGIEETQKDDKALQFSLGSEAG